MHDRHHLIPITRHAVTRLAVALDLDEFEDFLQLLFCRGGDSRLIAACADYHRGLALGVERARGAAQSYSNCTSCVARGSIYDEKVADVGDMGDVRGSVALGPDSLTPGRLVGASPDA